MSFPESRRERDCPLRIGESLVIAAALRRRDLKTSVLIERHCPARESKCVIRIQTNRLGVRSGGGLIHGGGGLRIVRLVQGAVRLRAPQIRVECCGVVRPAQFDLGRFVPQ